MKAGLEAGAEASIGGAGIDRDRYFVQPTVLKNATPEMAVAQEEIFGPVVTAMPFKDDSEIIRQANDSVYRLAAGIWTRDISKAHKFAKAVKARTVWVNCYSILTRRCHSVVTSNQVGGVRWGTRR